MAALTPSNDQLNLADVQEALRRLYLLPDVLAADIPEELMAFLRMTIHERDAGAARLARFLRETVHVEA